MIIEDNVIDADLLIRQLTKSGMSFISEVVDTRKTFEKSFELFGPDIILSDYSLPAFDAVTAFEIVKQSNLKIPFIIVSGTIGEENAVKLIKLGVTDFSSKENFPGLPQKVDRALKEAAEKQENEQLLEQLKIQTAALLLANQELEIQNAEKEKKAVELYNANKELLAFTFISSHDLQEPLRKIQVFISILMERESKKMSVAGKNNLERIAIAATRMRQLIQDLLNFSRVSTSEQQFEICDLSTIIEEVKYELTEEIRSKEAVIKIIDLVPVKIVVFQFRQLIYSLLSNALKFSISSAVPRIIIKSEILTNNDFNLLNLNYKGGKHDFWHLSIEDNGIGFEKQYNEMIFVIFKRLHQNEEYPGTGIGLAIVKKIVDNHNGIITADGKLNEGSVFNIYIPIQDVLNETIQNVNSKIIDVQISELD
nr:hybrid sensor histidine kinase/response regulator [Flavobacterium sp. MC2016-06]